MQSRSPSCCSRLPPGKRAAKRQRWRGWPRPCALLLPALQRMRLHLQLQLRCAVGRAVH